MRKLVVVVSKLKARMKGARRRLVVLESKLKERKRARQILA